MRKSKVVAITMGMIASCLFGGYAVVDAATVTLDDSTTGTPENPKPISETKTKKTATTETSIKTTPSGIKKTAVRNRNRRLAVTPEKEVPTEAVSTAAPVEDIKNTENQTETTTRIFVKSVSTSTEIKRDTLRPVSQNQKRLITPFETDEPTEEFEEPTEPTTEETPEEIIEETTTSSEQTAETTSETSETEPVTTASTRATVAEITTAKPKATTTTAETTSTAKATTTSTSTTKATTTTTTTTSTSTTTTTTTTTSTSTTTTTTTTSTTPEPVITTVATAVAIPAVQDSEIIDVSEIYLDNIIDSEFDDASITIEEVPEVIPETEEPEIVIVDTSNSVSNSDYILLCNAVAHEAGSDNITIENKAKVVEVIMNRVYSSSFPNTIYGVITQKSQFSGSSTYADLADYSSKVTQNVKSAVDLYFYDPSAFNHGYLYFYGDGSQNHFSQY